MRYVAALMILCLCFSKMEAQQGPTKERRAPQKTITEFFEALSTMDMNKIRATCTADVVILETGLIWNFDSLAFHLQKKRPADFKRVNRLDFVETHVKKDVAWLYYWNTATITANRRNVAVKWLESAVLIKEKDGWKIQLLHSTEIERQQ